MKPLSFLFDPQFLLPFLLLSGVAFAQQAPVNHAVDPGPRPDLAGAGLPLPAIASPDLATFNAGKDVFNEVEGTAKKIGPRFNLDSCAGCHAQLSMGGSSPTVNPQIAVASRNGAHNQIPTFVTQNGPVRVARLRRNADGSAAGGVVDIFTVTGRAHAIGCTVAQPNFEQLGRANNLSFRIPTPVFGLGLVEAIPDSTLLANLAATTVAKGSGGTRGHFQYRWKRWNHHALWLESPK